MKRFLPVVLLGALVAPAASGDDAGQAGVALSPMCPMEDSYCWIEVSNKTGCHAWVYVGPMVPEWSGDCEGGLASGEGVLTYPDWTVYQGSYVDGKQNGGWVEQWSSDMHAAGPYVDGKKNGHWVIRSFVGSGHVSEGPYVDGKKNGHWVGRSFVGSGSVSESYYVDGKKNGPWILRSKYGSTHGFFVDGKEHGRWVMRGAGTSTETCYRAGEEVDC